MFYVSIAKHVSLFLFGAFALLGSALLLGSVSPGDELFYTIPITSPDGHYPTPQASVDAINLLVRSDIEIIASANDRAVSIAAVPKILGKVPLSFGPFWLYDKKLQPKWMMQDTISVDHVLKPILPPQGFLYPGSRRTVDPMVRNMAMNEADRQTEKMSFILSVRAKSTKLLFWCSFATFILLSMAVLYSLYRKRFPKRIPPPPVPNWKKELHALSALPVDQAAVSLHALLCKYIVYKYLSMREHESLGSQILESKTLSEFIPTIERNRRNDSAVWIEVNQLLEKVLYDRQEVLFPEVLEKSQTLV